LNLESNDIVTFDKNALVGLTNLERVCMSQNPISNLFPESLTSMCSGNYKCNIIINSKCF